MMDDSFAKHLLVVIDSSSELSDRVVDYTFRLARTVGSTVSVVGCLDTASVDLLLQMHIFVKEESELFLAEMEQNAKRRIQEIKAQAAEQEIPLDAYLMRGRVHQVVLQAARQLNADAMVIGGWKNTATQKDTASLERQLILDQAEIPVIVIK